ncbi:heat shock protein HslJ [Vibrio astriarenae]|uniref:META domain-containing protein n=1 Tax=Vibrio astriarenae TaxID=1481923 RepID=A0A7Z2T3N9_9VIBR|nr:META domain-containing protein [Vibrio astriarenae]QIA63578.1 META domain-containing protein [Vibrio astriarenae]GAL11142.1 heat shock protein HslJ [Vibrio sp. C7]
MKLSSKSLLAAITLPVLLTACQSNGESMELTATDFQHHNWELVQIDGQDINLDSKEVAPRLEIGENMTANGNAGCNNFFGQAELKNNQLRIDKMGMTMKMCPDAAMEVEQAMSKTLMEWSDVTLTKDQMILTNGIHTLTFNLRDWVN